MKLSRYAGVVLLSIYIASVVLANWLTTRYGLIAVFPGLATTAGTVMIGGAIMTRDFLQDALGRLAVLGAIVVGAGLSYGLSSHKIALASGITFLLAETLEFLVYTPLRRRYGWGTRKWGSVVGLANATGAVCDTLLFLWLAGFSMTDSIVTGQLVGKAYITLAAVLAGLIIRRRLVRATA